MNLREFIVFMSAQVMPQGIAAPPLDKDSTVGPWLSDSYLRNAVWLRIEEEACCKIVNPFHCLSQADTIFDLYLEAQRNVNAAQESLITL